MAIFNEKIIKSFSDVEKIRNMQLKKHNLELEEICKMPEEERIEQMDKMRILLRLKKLYEELDVKVVQGEMIFYKGKAVVSEKQLKDISKLSDECFEEEMNYTKMIEEEKFILTDDIRKQLNDYIKIRELMLQSYIKHSMNAVIPELSPKSAFLMSSKEYNELIRLFSELNLVIKDEKVYVNDKAVETKGDYFGLLEKTTRINMLSIQLKEKLK